MSENNRKNIDGGVNVSLVAKISLYILIITSLFFIQIASAETWSTPNIVNEIGSQPALAIGKDNTLHFVWIENGKKLMYKRISKNGVVEIDAIPVANYDNTRVTLSSPDIVVDSNNNAHIVVQYTQVTDQLTYHWALYANVASTGIRSELKVLRQDYFLSGGMKIDCLNPRITLDPNDDKPAIIMKVKESHSYFSWLTRRDETDFWDGIKIAKKNGAGLFEWRSVLRTKERGPTDLYDFPNLVIDRNRNYHIVWFSNNENVIRYYSSPFDYILAEDVYENSEIIANNRAKKWFPSIDIDNANLAHISYEGEDGNIYYAKTPFLLSAIQITNNGQPEFFSKQPKIVVDFNGAAHIVYLEYISGKKDILYSRINKNQVIEVNGYQLTNHSNSDGDATHPDSAINKEGWKPKLHLTWQENREGNSQIMFRREYKPLVVIVDIDGLKSSIWNSYFENPINREKPIPKTATNYKIWDADGTPTTFPSVTFAAQASIFTGAWPKNHGIMGNQWFDRQIPRERDYVSLDAIDVWIESEGLANNDLTSRTIYEKLSENDKKSVVAANMYWKGTDSANYIEFPQSLTEYPYTGIIGGFALWYIFPIDYDRLTMARTINQLKESIDTDSDISNDSPDLLTVYFSGPDHYFHINGLGEQGEQGEQYQYLRNVVDPLFSDLSKFLESQNQYSDTVFLFVSDHGHMNGKPSDKNYNKNLWDELITILKDEGFFQEEYSGIIPPNVIIAPNGPVTFLYIENRDSDRWSDPPKKEDIELIRDAIAKDMLFKSTLDGMLVKDPPGTREYKYYSIEEGKYVSNYPVDFSEPEKRISESNSAKSPDIVLLPRRIDGYEINKNPDKSDHGSLYKDDSNSIFFITGEGLKQFFDENGYSSQKNLGISESYIVDVAPSAINLLLPITTFNDGKSIFSNRLLYTINSPVEPHIYDSKGRHVGIKDGKIETEIPNSFYKGDGLGPKTITIYDPVDKYNIVLKAQKEGSFTSSLEKSSRTESIKIEYPRINITNNTLAYLDVTESSNYKVRVDSDGDSSLDDEFSPSHFQKVTAPIFGDTVNITFSAPPNQTMSIDVHNAQMQINLRTNSQVEQANIFAQTSEFSDFDAQNAYTIRYFNLSSSGNLVNNLDGITITFSYMEKDLIESDIVEKTLDLYYLNRNEWFKVNSIKDTFNNTITASVSQFGAFAIAGTDKIPIITEMLINPEMTNIPGSSFKLSANITDDTSISNASAEINGLVWDLSYNSISGNYEANMQYPIEEGIYTITIRAMDNNGNIGTEYSTVMVDTTSPEIQILSPKNETYNNYTLELSLLLSEPVLNITYNIDEGENVSIISDEDFIINTTIEVPHGKHKLTVCAQDLARNTGCNSTDYSVAEHNILLTDLNIPEYKRPNEKFSVNVSIFNSGQRNETVTLNLFIDNILQDNQTVSLMSRDSLPMSFSLSLLQEGVHNISVQAVPVQDEIVIKDNIVNSSIKITSKNVVLIVDDYIYSNSTSYIQGILNGGFEYIGWDMKLQGSPPQSILSEYPLIFWFTGNKTINTLTSTDQSNLQKYLDKGGYLFLTGENLGQELGKTQFFSNYLQASYINDNIPTKTLEGVYGDPIGNGLLFSTSGDGDVIAPLTNNSSSIINYEGDGTAAIKTKTDSFKTIYIAFDLAKIDMISKNQIINGALNWFDIDMVPPVLFNIYPANNTNFSKGTSNITFGLETNEKSECRYSNNSNKDFDIMKIMDNTYSMVHSSGLYKLNNGTNYDLFIKCADMRKNINETWLQIHFSIINRTFLSPILDYIDDITINETSLVHITPTASDPESDPLTFTFSPPLNSSGTWQTTYEDAGEYTARVTVSDGFSNVSQDVKITVLNVNRPPVLSPIGTLNATAGSYFSYNVIASDPDNDQLTYSDDSPIFDINPFTGEIGFVPRGNQSFNITVSDGTESVSEKGSLEVRSTNSPPEMEFIFPKTALSGSNFTLAVNASDPDGDNITYADDTELFDINATTGRIEFTPGSGQIGTYFINITVTDGIETDEAVLNLVVRPDRPLRLEPVQDIVAYVGDLVKIIAKATYE